MAFGPDLDEHPNDEWPRIGRCTMFGIGDGCLRPMIPVISIGLFIATSGTSALGNESSCRRLEVLSRQYAGVQLTNQQQHLKRKLVAWYNGNCRQTRSASGQRLR
jgi:hypothetical protein